MAKVTASGSPSLTSVAAFQTQLRSDPTLGESFISGTTEQCLLAKSNLLPGNKIPDTPIREPAQYPGTSIKGGDGVD